MVKPVPSYLKLRTAESEVAPPDVADLPGLETLCGAFAHATGWPLRFAAGPASVDQTDVLWSAPVDPGVGASPGHLRIELGTAKNVAQLAARVPLEAAEELAAAVVGLLQQTFKLRKTLWKREAELAAGVPVAARPDEPQHFALRLEAALKSGTQLLGCDAAALYTLDEATTELKLRSSWGLPFERLEQPARPLATALADLEALLGNAVALESTQTFRPWNVPEPCEAALCVPVSSPTMPLGTLWFYSHGPRPFTGEQTNLAEIIAGRLSSELERAVLLHEQTQSVAVLRQLDDASRIQQQALSQSPPPLDGWQAAGWTSQAAALGGAFHDWRMLDDGRLAIVVADACDGGVAGAMVAAGLRAALRACLTGLDDPAQILNYLHDSLQSHGAGDEWAGIVLAILGLKTGEATIASAGRPTALWLPRGAPRALIKPSLPLGLGDRFQGKSTVVTVAPGDALALYSRGFIEVSDEQGLPLNEQLLAEALCNARGRTASELIDILCDRQEAHALVPNQIDRSVVVVKRLPR
ncbi:MAG: SpoIIE family protein phosphatase [Pirellulales bacterium]